MSCITCKYARKLSNSSRTEVACHLSTRIEAQEEILIDALETLEYSMYYINQKPKSNGKGLQTKGLIVPSDFKCISFRE